jgi:anti-sigma B factor antagonist
MTNSSQTGLVIDVERCDRSVVVRLAGELDLSTAGDLRGRLRDLLADGCDRLVIDLARVDVVALIGVYKRTRALRTELVLWRPSSAVHQVLALTGLTRVFRIELRDDVDPREAAAVAAGADGDVLADHERARRG